MERQMRRAALGAATLMALLAAARAAPGAAGIVWERVEGIYGASVARLGGTDDGALLAGTGRGLYRSDDDGGSWTRSGFAGEQVDAMAVDGQTVYVGVSMGGRRAVRRSDDGGQTWEVTGLKLRPHALAVADGVVYAVYSVGNARLGVFRSADRGATWSETRLGAARAAGVAIMTDGVAAASMATVFRSADGEGDWAEIGDGLPDEGLVALAAIGRTLYVAAGSAGVYRLDAGSETWTRTSLEGVEVEWLRSTGAVLYAGVQGFGFHWQPVLVRSDDRGLTWTDIEIVAGVHASDALVVGSREYIGAHGGVFVSDDDGVAWRNVSRGMADVSMLALAASGDRVYAGGRSGVHVSGDRGRTWRRTDFYRSAPVLSAHERTVHVATWWRGLFRSDDGGNTWRAANDGVPMGGSAGDIHVASSSPREILRTKDQMYVAYYHGAFLRSADGEAWEPPSGPMRGDAPVFSFGDGPLSIGEHDGALYVNAHCYTARSFDGGLTWEELPSGPCLRGADFHTFDDHLFLAAETGVYRWSEAAREWLDASEGLPLQRENRPNDDARAFHGTRFASLGQSLYVGGQTHTGVFRLYKAADHWVSAGLDDLHARGLLAYDDALFAGTDEGLFRATADQSVGVEPRGKGATAWGRVKLAALRPDRPALLPNYPNPFSPETWTPFDLSESAHVTLRIYDARGRVVRTLDVRRLSPGRYRDRERAAHWDGRNAAGSPVASGVYVVEVVAGSYSARRKMVVQK